MRGKMKMLITFLFMFSLTMMATPQCLFYKEYGGTEAERFEKREPEKANSSCWLCSPFIIDLDGHYSAYLYTDVSGDVYINYSLDMWKSGRLYLSDFVLFIDENGNGWYEPWSDTPLITTSKTGKGKVKLSSYESSFYVKYFNEYEKETYGPFT